MQSYLTVKLIIQPLVENSLIHGIDPLHRKGVIRIRAFELGERDLCIEVADNGAGIDNERMAELFQPVESRTRHAGDLACSMFMNGAAAFWKRLRRYDVLGDLPRNDCSHSHAQVVSCEPRGNIRHEEGAPIGIACDFIIVYGGAVGAHEPGRSG